MSEHRGRDFLNQLLEAFSGTLFTCSWFFAALIGSCLESINVNLTHLLIYSVICFAAGWNFIPVINRWLCRESVAAHLIYMATNLSFLVFFFSIGWEVCL